MPACRPVSCRVPRPAAVLAAVATLVAAGTATYTIQRGDTLSALAARHGTTVDALAHANGLSDPDFIVAGGSLQLASTSSGSSASGSSAGRSSGNEPTANIEHVVAAGETLSSVVARYRVSLDDVAGANGLSAPYTIYEGQRLRVPGGGSAAPVAASASRQEVGALIERVAREYGWNPSFVKALAWQESGWNNQVVSSAGAIGIMQVMPDTGEFVEDYLVGRELDLSDPHDNVTAGVAFLDYLHDVTGGDVRLVLGGYYQGLRSIDRNGFYSDTEQYIDSILALRERY